MYIRAYIKFDEAVTAIEPRAATLPIDLSLRAIKFYPPDISCMILLRNSVMFIPNVSVNPKILGKAMYLR